MNLNKEEIITYYNQCEWQYRMGWKLGSNMAMHGGYWDRDTKTLEQALDKENEVLANKAGINKSDAVLDAGCGVGGSSVYLAKKYGCRVTGITITPRQVKTATAYAEKMEVTGKVNFLERNYLDTGFKDNSFDVVWAVESVCYAPDKAEFLKEAYRILKPGGRLILADLFQKKPKLTPWEDDLLNRRTFNRVAVPSLAEPSYFTNEAEKLGFKINQLEDITEHTLKSFRKMYWGSMRVVWLGWILRKLNNITQVEYENLLVGIHLKKSRIRNLWFYGVFYAEK